MENSLTKLERLSDQSIEIYYDQFWKRTCSQLFRWKSNIHSSFPHTVLPEWVYSYNIQHETTTNNLLPFLVFFAIFLSRWYSFFAILSFFAVFLFSYWSSYGSKVMKMYSISIYPPVISSTSKLKAKRCWIEWFSCLCGKGCMEVAHRFINLYRLRCYDNLKMSGCDRK